METRHERRSAALSPFPGRPALADRAAAGGGLRLHRAAFELSAWKRDARQFQGLALRARPCRLRSALASRGPAPARTRPADGSARLATRLGPGRAPGSIPLHGGDALAGMGPVERRRRTPGHVRSPPAGV